MQISSAEGTGFSDPQVPGGGYFFILQFIFPNSSAVYLPSSTECAGGKPGMSSLCQDICQIAFTSKLVTLFIIYPGARLNGYR